MGTVKILSASAGSGKTYRLVREFVTAIVDNPLSYRNILAVTFTNKATEEMKERILSVVDVLASGAMTGSKRDDLSETQRRTREAYLSDITSELGMTRDEVCRRAMEARTNILHDYGRFSVVTIDKFFQRIIRSFIRELSGELGIDLNFNIELRTDTLLGSAADAIIDQIPVDESLREWMLEFIEERIRQNRSWELKGGLVSLGQELFKEEYKSMEHLAGSKDDLRKIVSRARESARPSIERLQELGRRFADIMDTYSMELQDFPYKESGFAAWPLSVARGEIKGYGARVLAALESEEKWFTKKSERRDAIEAMAVEALPLLREMCGFYDSSHRMLATVALLENNYRNFALLTDMSQRVAEICARERIMPISETNNILYKLIAGNDAPFIFEKVGNVYSRFMIDEFQDTSSMQWANFIPLIDNALAQSDSAPVLVVGDVKQSIYRWRGGDWRILARRVGERFTSEQSSLTANRRSSRVVVEFNNALISRCVELDGALLERVLDDACRKGYIKGEYASDLSGMLPEAYCDLEQTPFVQDEGYVTITRLPKKAREAALTEMSADDAFTHVVRRVEELQDRGFRAGDIAILVRNNYEGAEIASRMLEYKRTHGDARYNYDMVSADALKTGSSPTVAFILACLSLSADPSDAISLAVYNRHEGRGFHERMDEADNMFFASLALMPVLDAFEKIVHEKHLGENAEDVAYLQALHDRVIWFTNTSVSDIPLFLKWWNENGAVESVNIPEGRTTITIQTIHKSKGLEFGAVILPYCNWSMAPKTNSIIWGQAGCGELGTTSSMPVNFTGQAGESFFAADYYRELVLSHIDNMNIFYVAATRAKRELHIIYPATSGIDNESVSPRINNIIDSVAVVSGGEVCVGSLSGLADELPGGGVRLSFGVPSRHTFDTECQKPVPAPFPTRAHSAKPSLKLTMQHHFDDTDVPHALTPRNYGLLMHRAFEGASTVPDIRAAVEKMRLDGEISAREAATVSTSLDKVLADPVVRGWFDGSWEVVRNENRIILPGGAPRQRPDRVMIHDGKAIVVDYKFGTEHKPAYRTQINKYMDSLRAMGYKEVEGYIWYVTLREIDIL